MEQFHHRSHRLRHFSFRPQPQGTGKTAHQPPRHEHLIALHADDHDRVFHIRRHRHPFHGKSADGSKFTGGHLHIGTIPEP